MKWSTTSQQLSNAYKMRLIKQEIERKDGSGKAVLLPEEPEDMVSTPYLSSVMQRKTVREHS